MAFGRDARPQPWLAEQWVASDDGTRWRLTLRRNVGFHDGTPLNATTVCEILERRLPQELGWSGRDIAFVRPVSEHELEIGLTRRSAFFVEGLGFPIERVGPAAIGTGPFIAVPGTGTVVEMTANAAYYGGTPAIDRISVVPYQTVRAAWADMLRGQVDLLYDVGSEAVGFVEPSSQANVHSFERPYTSLVILNVRNPRLASADVRRALNAAIDRDAIVREGLNGQGTPATGVVWPHHWAYDHGLPRFTYEPRRVTLPEGPLTLRLLYAEPSHERLALITQRQLQQVGARVSVERAPLDDAFARLEGGDFDMFLADAGTGPTMIRQFFLWYSGAPRNYGGYGSSAVDAALDAIRTSLTDDDYKAGVAAFQRAIVDDPPAIFLAWSQRARAVSTRFHVPVEPGRDILSTLRLWRPN